MGLQEFFYIIGIVFMLTVTLFFVIGIGILLALRKFMAEFPGEVVSHASRLLSGNRGKVAGFVGMSLASLITAVLRSRSKSS